MVETQRGLFRPRLIARCHWSFSRNDIRVRFSQTEMLVDTRTGETFRWWLDFENKHTTSQRLFFDTLAAQAGVTLP